VTVLALVVTVVAVVLAYKQIKQAREDAKAAQTAQLKERRVDFELTVPRKLPIAAHWSDYLHVRALASTLAPSVVPISRAAAGLATTPHGERVAKRVDEQWSLPEGTYPGQYLNLFKDLMTAELVNAIDKRVHEREPIGSD
jgi:hypothetical protein